MCADEQTIRMAEVAEKVRALMSASQDVLYAQLGGHLNPTDQGTWTLDRLRQAWSALSQ